MKMCKKCLISGRVQGVFYRASAQRQAQSLGVTGWAKNLPDGTVEVMACGEEDAVNTLCDWCREGPEYARVISVECEEQGFQELSGFTTR